jgi:hypothetical protein
MRIALLSLVLLLSLPQSAQAEEICDLINDVANGWNDMANLLDADDADSYTDSDFEAIGEALGALTESSATLAGLLQGAGDDYQVALGEDLEKVILTFADKVDSGNVQYLADSIDGTTDAMDRVTDDCDASQ